MTIFESNMFQPALENSGIAMIDSIPMVYRRLIPDTINLMHVRPDMVISLHQERQKRTIFEPAEVGAENMLPLNDSAKVSRIFINDPDNEDEDDAYIWVYFNHVGSYELRGDQHNIIIPEWMKYKARSLWRAEHKS